MYSTICLLVFLVVTFIYFLNKKPSNFPPGPSWLPIFGSLFELKKLSVALGGQHKAFSALSKHFKTDVLGLKLGGNLVVVISGRDVLKNVMNSGEYDHRPFNFFAKLRCMNTENGITFANGDLWSTQRNFFLRHIRNLGFGKQPMDLIIKEEINEILHFISSIENQEVPINGMVSPAVINTLWSLLAGKRISPESPRFKKLLYILKRRDSIFDMSGGLLSHFPWLRFIMPNITGYNLIVELNKEMRDFFLEIIQEHYDTWYDGRDDDYIYTFITEMKRGTQTFTEQQLIMVCLDIFIAGSLTTSISIDFLFLVMIHHPDIQKRVQKELDLAFKSSFPSYNDKSKVPYVEAVLYEVERFYPVAPITGPRCASTGTNISGYNIPKEASILINNYSVLHDVNVWGDPENFRPERFLNENGEIVGTNNLFTFNLGKRRCLGEALAKNFIFTYFTGVLSKYTIVSDIEIDSDPEPGITLCPKQFKAKFIPR